MKHVLIFAVADREEMVKSELMFDVIKFGYLYPKLPRKKVLAERYRVPYQKMTKWANQIR